MSRRSRRLLVVALTFGALALTASPAWASSSPPRLLWKAGAQADFVGPIALGSMYCPSSDQCDALDAVGRLAQFNPQQFVTQPSLNQLGHSTTTLQAPAPLQAMACTPADCTFLAADGEEATLNLGAVYGGQFDYVRVDRDMTDDSKDGPSSLACPSQSRCVIADGAGGVVSFSPTDPSGATRTQLVTGDGSGMVGIACPSTTQCTAISPTREWTFDPADPAAATSAAIDSAPGAATALACASTTQCTAVDSSGRETTFDPATTSGGTPLAVAAGAHADFTAVVCSSATLCTAADANGALQGFDPSGGAIVSSVPATGVDDLLCISALLCLADQDTGDVLPFTPGTSASLQNDSAVVDSGSAIVGISCAQADRCIGVDTDHQASFDPTDRDWHGGGIYTFPDGAHDPITGVACPQLTLCTVVRGDEQISFDPYRFRHLDPRVADHDGDATFTAVRCPTRTECVGVDSGGVAVTYDPADGHISQRAIDVQRGRALTALACPSAAQCTATDDDGTAISFDPLDGRRLLTDRIDDRVGLDTPTGGSRHELDAISCDGGDSCVAVDTLGDVMSFDPLSRHGATLRRVDRIDGLTGVACPTSGLCVLTDGDGRVLTGRPGAADWAVKRLFQAAALTGVTCESAKECVATDSAGDAFLGY